jgi:hypothetical protein
MQISHKQEVRVKYAPILSQLMKRAVLGVSTIVFFCAMVSFVAAQASFFQGKTITLIQGRDPGGSGDFRTKAVATEIDPALLRGEIDARATGADTVTQRNKEWLEKGSIVDFHAILEVPKGEKHLDFPRVPEIETFAKSDRPQSYQYAARFQDCRETPFVLPPGTPKDRVEIIQTAFRRAYQDPEFFKEYKKLTGDEPTPLLPEAHEKAVREIPREREVVEVFKKLVGAGPLPAR